MIFDELVENIERGVRGENVFAQLKDNPYREDRSKLSGLVNLDNNTHVLIGGESGTGKTSITDSVFVLNIYLESLNSNMNPVWIYRSMERSRVKKLAKWLCYMLYWDHDMLIDTATVLQLSNKKRDLTDEDLKLFKSYRPFFEKLLTKVDLISGTTTPDEAYSYAFRKAFKYGTYIRATEREIFANEEKAYSFDKDHYEVFEGVKKYWQETKWGKIFQKEIKYVPLNPQQLRMAIYDHVGKFGSDKKILDRHAHNQGQLRDVGMYAPIDVQQFNRGNQESARKIKMALTVMSSDFKGTGEIFNSADLVFGILNPAKHDVSRSENYNINKCKSINGHNRLRLFKLVKNEGDMDDFTLGLGFLGECGAIKELDPGKQMDDTKYELLTEGKFKSL